MSDQPKPTGEWTAGELVECVNGVGYKELARRINAALAAEREKFQKAKEWNRITEFEVNNLRSLLDALDPDISRKTIAELRQQLATAAKALKRYMVAMDAIYNHNEGARAAVEIHFGTLHPPEAFDALAKVKDAQ